MKTRPSPRIRQAFITKQTPITQTPVTQTSMTHMTQTSMTQTDKILVIKLGALGDFIQTMGVMKAIRAHHNDAHITLLTTRPFEKLARDCGYFDDIHIDTKPKWYHLKHWMDLRRFLTKSGFTRVYDLQNNDRTALYFRLIPRHDKPEWVGVAKGASHANPSPDRTAGHAFDGHRRTLALAGIQDITVDDLLWMESDLSAFHLPDNMALLIPGCAPNRPEKRWPAESYGALARRLYSDGYTPVIIGTQTEKEIAQIICDLAPQAIDLTGQTGLTDLPALARKARFAVGNDTGPMHFIGPAGTPAFVLFSKHSDPVRHKPLGKHVYTLQTEEIETLEDHAVMEFITQHLDRKT